jgi:hypothetical protein
MTPPLSISASPTFRRRLVLVRDLFPLFSGIFFDLDSIEDRAGTPVGSLIGNFYQCSSDAVCFSGGNRRRPWG